MTPCNLHYSVYTVNSLVIVHDGVEPVGNRDDSAVSKLCSDGLLNEIISLQVHGSRGLIQYQDLGFTEQGSSKTHQLTLTNTVREKWQCDYLANSVYRHIYCFSTILPTSLYFKEGRLGGERKD